MRRFALPFVIACLAVLHAGEAQAAISCKLNVVPTMGSPYAATYDDHGTVVVRSKEGRTLVGLRVDLVTFSGERIGLGRKRGKLRGFGTARVPIRLPYGLQAGRYTLVVSELLGRGCGTPKRIAIIRMLPCTTVLPIQVPERPTGRASDYEDYLSFDVAAKKGAFIQDLRTRVLDRAGQVIAETRSDAVFGRLGLDLALAEPLSAGRYTLAMSGRVRGLPEGCGEATRDVALRFR